MYVRSPMMRRRIARIRDRSDAGPHDARTAPPFGAAALSAFEHSLNGEALVPGDAGYEAARQVVYRQFQRFPQIIVYCETPGDAARALAFAGEHGLAVRCRSSGHNSGGFSVGEGMVLDLSRMNAVWVDPARRLAVAQSGATFHRLNAALSDHGLHVPGGGCDTVCVGGYMQGGGYGFTSRAFGMNCDNVVEAQAMLWNGRTVTASATKNPDLFWALRGGGGAFGVLLNVTYALRPLGPLWGFGLSWGAADAPAALAMLQADYMRGSAHERVCHQAAIMLADDGPRFYLRGMYVGTEEEGRRAIAPLAALPGARADILIVGSYRDLNRSLLENPVPIPTAPDYAFEEVQSGYVAAPVDIEHWRAVMDFMAGSPSPWNDIGIEPYGGAIERAAGDNAFIHRAVDMNLFLEVFWLRPHEREAAVAWLDAFMALMRPAMNGQSYQNYPRPGLPDAQAACWGEALPRLRAIKAKYNPHDWFANSQSFAPADGCAEGVIAHDD